MVVHISDSSLVGDLVNTGKPVTTTLIVADRFGKEHHNVLAALNNLECSEEFRKENFFPYQYKAANGKMNPAYYLSHDGFMFLVMGFTGKEAAAWKERFIRAFNAMAEKLAQHEAASHVPAPVEATPVESHSWTLNLPVADFEAGLEAMRKYISDTPMPQSDRLRLYREYMAQSGMDVSFMPDPRELETAYPMSALLKRHGAVFSAQTANRFLVGLGLLEERMRVSRGQEQKYKVLTASGLVYGRNVSVDHNFEITHPVYFEHSFPELLAQMYERLPAGR